MSNRVIQRPNSDQRFCFCSFIFNFAFRELSTVFFRNPLRKFIPCFIMMIGVFIACNEKSFIEHSHHHDALGSKHNYKPLTSHQHGKKEEEGCKEEEGINSFLPTKQRSASAGFCFVGTVLPSTRSNLEHQSCVEQSLSQDKFPKDRTRTWFRFQFSYLCAIVVYACLVRGRFDRRQQTWSFLFRPSTAGE